MVAARQKSPENIVSQLTGSPNVELTLPKALASIPDEVQSDKELMKQLAAALLNLAKTT